MTSRLTLLAGLFWFCCYAYTASAADVVPTDVQQPGTQPQEVGELESADRCDNCHGGYDLAIEPAHNWRGSMMSHAARDPIFWASLAIAEQDFDGSGDLCLRCHMPGGWLGGRSTPTDGSGLAPVDAEGVTCDFCHTLTDTDNSEHLGVMNQPFVANEYEPNNDALFDWDGTPGVEGYYGSAMASMWAGNAKLGPHDDADIRHRVLHSRFHRDRDFCGTCHDVSDPAVGDLAPNHGAQPQADPVVADGTPGSQVDGKAAFNNPPYKYGTVERTFSEYKAGLISRTLVADYHQLPIDLQAGALAAVYDAATRDGTVDGNYVNPTAPRYFSCQSCHMRPVVGKGASNSGTPVRQDLPLHDMTGGNYWMHEAMEYLDAQGKLRFGGGMSQTLKDALHDGALRAREQLELAASLIISDDNNSVRVINHTGHKLISGYPEGRRMWLNIKWRDANGDLIEEFGEYGEIGVVQDGVSVRSLLKLFGDGTRIYEVHNGLTQEWASKLVQMGYDPGLVLSYDRMTGQPTSTLGELAAAASGTSQQSFHFVLNNTIIDDNRIPPYGMSYELARIRNTLPVPDNQYGGAPGGTYDYFDEVPLDAPAGARTATISLMYQPTSWEYVQFLYLANKGTDPAQGGNAFLGEEGANMLDAWLNTGMAEPHVMASVEWSAPPPGCY